MKKGFGLVEIIVVIAIIGILGSIVGARVMVAREKARIASGRAFERHMKNKLALTDEGDWSFDSPSGGVVSDASGNDRTGALMGGTLVVEDDCIRGSCLSFDGTDDYVDITPTDSFDGLSEGTIAAWVKWEGTNPNLFDAWFASDSGSCVNPFELAIHEEKFEVWADSSGCSAEFNATVPLGDSSKWHYLAYVVDTDGNQFYVDGKRVIATYIQGSESSTFFFADASAGTTQYNIGNTISQNEWFPGLVDSLYISSRALSSQEVGALHEEGRTRYASL